MGTGPVGVGMGTCGCGYGDLWVWVSGSHVGVDEKSGVRQGGGGGQHSLHHLLCGQLLGHPVRTRMHPRQHNNTTTTMTKQQRNHSRARAPKAISQCRTHTAGGLLLW